jgi:glutaminyl-peptide cyclotransferase
LSSSNRIAVSLLLVILILLTGCNGAGARSGPQQTPPPPPAPEKVGVQRPVFDGQKAYQLLVKQCEFGPRPVGSEAHLKTRDFLLAAMRKYADRTETQDFTYRGMPLSNIIGVFNPEAMRSILLCAHWDTRPTADMEIDPARKSKPIPGASDGASGVAVLLELARIFKEQKPQVGVILVLLDGEDYGNFEKDEGVFLGSRHFARNHSRYRPAFGILLDMVGDKDLDIYPETYSQQYAPGVNAKVFRIARELGYGKQFIDNGKLVPVVDDHIALNQARIPTIDLIDFDYGPWHTLEDTPDKCSAASLTAVGETLAEVVYREASR